MPTCASRKSKGKRAKWKEESIRFTLEVLKNEQMGINKAAKTFSIPKTTLLKGFEQKNKHSNNSKI